MRIPFMLTLMSVAVTGAMRPHPLLMQNPSEADATAGVSIFPAPLGVAAPNSASSTPYTRRSVAVIGGGAAGASAAYFLSRATSDLPPNITLYEATGRIGGRAKLLNISTGDGGTVSVETGASIFVTINKNIHDFAKENNISFVPNDDQNSGGGVGAPPALGIHDGSKFVWTSTNALWRDLISAVWRWGYTSTTRSRSLALSAGDRFGRNYDVNRGPWGYATVPDLLERLDLRKEALISAREFFKSEKIGNLYLDEFIEAATRVNYGQNLDINALSALVCLVAAFVPATAIDGGNERVFSEMAAKSMAKVLLNTPVTRVTKTVKKDGRITYDVTDATRKVRNYDAVILAVPPTAALKKIVFDGGIKTPKPIPFIHLHVTFVTGVLDPTYFGLAPNAKVPQTVLTTRAKHGERQAPFNSISVNTVLKDGQTTITKIFSPERMTDGLLSNIYSTVHDVIRLEWDSYPVLRPMFEQDIPQLELDTGGNIESFGGGIYHVNSFEAVLSTMESETVAAENAVQLMLRRWRGEPPVKIAKAKI